MKIFWKELKRPIKVLSPMAGYTDSAFRLLCRQFGADVVMTELISADAVAYAKFKIQNSKFKINEEDFIFNKVICSKNRSTADLLSFFEEERPLVVQLFGKNPENFAKAAKWITEELKPDGIDINMGCPAKKVVKSGHGAALIKNSDLAVEIIKAVKDNTDLPVSVKTRLGWEDKDEILKFAPILWEAGIDALIIHARTYKQGFSGKADWGNIFKVKSVLPELCVIGNGDLTSISNFQFLTRLPDGQVSNPPAIASLRRAGQIPNPKSQSNEAMEQCNNVVLDGVAIGRAAFGKPWIFRDNSKIKIQKSKLRNNSNLEENISAAEVKKTILKHAELVYSAKGDHGLIELRKHLLAYLKGNPEAKELRREAVAISSISDIKKLIEKI